jgi:hypothetical protein
MHAQMGCWQARWQMNSWISCAGVELLLLAKQLTIGSYVLACLLRRLQHHADTKEQEAQRQAGPLCADRGHPHSQVLRGHAFDSCMLTC